LGSNGISDRPHETLTNKELEIFKMLAVGKTITEIAEILSLALTTVSTHRSRILSKLDLHNNSDLTRYAISHHIVTDIDGA
jgi:DNA-binding NarL/FixJ family response regulator